MNNINSKHHPLSPRWKGMVQFPKGLKREKKRDKEKKKFSKALSLFHLSSERKEIPLDE